MNTRSKTALLPRASLSKRDSCPHPLPAYLRVESLLSHTLSVMFSCFGSTMAHSLHKVPSKLLSHHHHHQSHNQQQQSRGLANDFPPLPSAVCSAAVLSKYVALLCEHSSASPPKHTPLHGHPNLAKHVYNPFHLHHPPPLPLAEFADRLHKYFACSSAAFIVSSLYLHRLHTARPALFTPRSAHKLLLTALTLAAKFCDDVACKQSHYAKCGGIEVAELNALESFFASVLRFELFVATEAFERAVGVLGHVHKAFEVAGAAEQEEAVYVVSAYA